MLLESTNTVTGYFEGIELADLSDNEIPEMVLRSACTGSGGFDYSQFYTFKKNKWCVMEIVDTNKNVFEGYNGHNKYYVEDRKLYNEFQLYNDSDANCCPTTGLLRTVEYKLKNSRFYISDYKDISDPDWAEMKMRYMDMQSDQTYESAKAVQ